MSLSDNSLAGVSFEDLVKQMPKEFKDRFSEINKHIIENDKIIKDIQKIQDQLQRKNSKDNSKKMRDKIILLNTKLSRVCDLHKEIAIICQTKMNSK